MLDMVNGSIRARAWPRKRGKGGSPEQKANREKFALAQRASRYISPQEYVSIINATQGTPLLPRDLITMRTYNRMLAFLLPNGITLMPNPAKNDVSAALDALSQTPGMTVVRTDDGWREAPYAGNNGEPAQVAEWRWTTNVLHVGAPYANLKGDVVIRDPGAWLDLTTGNITPTARGWYDIRCSVYVPSHGVYRMRAVTGAGLAYTMALIGNGPTDVMVGNAQVPYEPSDGPITVQLYRNGGFHVSPLDQLSFLTIMGPVAPYIESPF